ncbi:MULTISPECIES: hypothetical protein [Streptomyces]|uniref:hypothetical protein n=1 Tax=Streptomyces TaxID=1883 RepID=UPI0004AA7CF9|nr:MULTISPECIES: hypothetical protein [Streptomyces]
MALTDRVAARLADRFGPEADATAALLEEAEGRVQHGQDRERITAALVVLADGSPDRLHDAILLLETDWRDLLMSAELADGDWPSKLDDLFGPK